ncbi:MAG TPA: VOC family protein [Acidimicrobiales bacterium]|nr:VOC family protein [Acidimicrobiales bacterium]
MEPIGVDHVAINVIDVPASIDFYTSVLGLAVRHDRPEFGFAGAWLDAGGQQVHLVEAAMPPSLGQHFSLLVANLDAVIDELREGGVAVTDPFAVGRDRQAFLADPSGNTIELHERGAQG